MGRLKTYIPRMVKSLKNHKLVIVISFIALLLIAILVALTFFLTKTDTITPAVDDSLLISENEETFVVGVLISMAEDTPFFISLIEGVEEASSRLNVDLVLRYAHDNVELQNSQILTLVDEGIDALLVNPISDDVSAVIVAANNAGVPIFTIDRSVSSDLVVSHIASDNFVGGKMAGEYLAESLNRNGKIIELEGTPGSSAANDRGEGFNQAILAYPDIEVIDRGVANFNKNYGQTVFAQMLAEHPDIDGVFAHNDDMILGAVIAAQEVGRAEDIVFIGFDGTGEAIAALERGDLLATIAQRPAEIGRIGLETTVKYLRGESVPGSIFVNLALITK